VNIHKTRSYFRRKNKEDIARVLSASDLNETLNDQRQWFEHRENNVPGVKIKSGSDCRASGR
jgi:hypothetical protein